MAHMGGPKAHRSGPKANKGGPKAHQTPPEGLEFEGPVAPSNSINVNFEIPVKRFTQRASGRRTERSLSKYLIIHDDSEGIAPLCLTYARLKIKR